MQYNLFTRRQNKNLLVQERSQKQILVWSNMLNLSDDLYLRYTIFGSNESETLSIEDLLFEQDYFFYFWPKCLPTFI